MQDMSPSEPLANAAKKDAQSIAFTFGEPEPVLDTSAVFDYLQCFAFENWYSPPISLDGLARVFRSSPHHSSAIYVKRNILVSTFIPHRLLTREAFAKASLDYLVMGNTYLERRDAIGGRPLALEHCLAKFMRRGVKDGEYFFIADPMKEHKFKRWSVFHLLEPDLNQELYGVPEYISALQAALLNESSTLFRRKYYTNGSHAGYILYISDAVNNAEDIDAIKSALKSAKGPGNFRNLFLYSPQGKKDGVQVIPISEVAAKDEFMGIKNATRDDILAAHRVPPQLLGVIPTNTGGFGAVAPAAQVFVKNELEPLQNRFRELNDWIGEEVVRFKDYVIAEPT